MRYTRLLGLAGLLAGFLLPGAAYAACAPPLVAADKNGVAQNMEAVNTAAGNCAGVVSTYPAEAVSATLQSGATSAIPGTALTVTGSAAVGITVNCATCSGGTTVTFEGNTDAANFGPICMTPLGGGVCQTSTTASGITQWERPTGGLQQVRARISTYGAGTITATAEAVPVGGTPASSSAYQATSPWVVSLSQLNGGTVATGIGAANTNTQRVVLSTDSVLAANQSTNVAQFGGTNITTGVGGSGTGIPRVTVANDSQVKTWDGTNVATIKASGANAVTTDTSQVVALSPNPSTVCTLSKPVNITASADLITSAAKLHICSIVLVDSAQEQISIVEGTGGTNCGTGTVALLGATTADATHGLALGVNGGFSAVSDRPWMVTNTTADHFCILKSGTGLLAGTITYTDHN